jgi:glyoxylase-like metal-dependent hydrolase (beta-lactamase superfamily II)
VLLWYAYFEGMVQSGPGIITTLPNILFTDSLWIHGSRRSLKLKEFRKGHTGSDVVLMLPRDGIVFTSDLFFNDAHPYLGDGDPDALVGHLSALSADRNMRRFVPGHGPVGDRTALERLAGYVEDLERIVREGRSLGLSDSAIQASPIPASYAGWTFGRRFFEDNLALFCRKLKS